MDRMILRPVIKGIIKEHGMQHVLEDLIDITTEIKDKYPVNNTYLKILINDLQNTYDNYMLRHENE